MLINNFAVIELNKLSMYLHSKELGVYAIISDHLGISTSQISTVFKRSHSHQFGFSDIGTEQKKDVILGHLQEKGFNDIELPSPSPFDDIDWLSSLNTLRQGFPNLIRNIETTVIPIALPDIFTLIFNLEDEQSIVFDFCSAIYSISTSLEISSEDKKMLLNKFHSKLLDCIAENNLFLESKSLSNEYIIDSVKIINKVYQDIESELPKTGIYQYVNSNISKTDLSSVAIETYFSLNPAYKFDLSAFCGKLKRAEFIDKNTKEPSIKNIFKQNNQSKIIWTGTKNSLYFLFKNMKDKKIITNRYYRLIVNYVFVDNNKNSINLATRLKAKDYPKASNQRLIIDIISTSFLKK